MAALNVLPPDCLDRVREYALEIVVYIEKIIEKGYHYGELGSKIGKITPLFVDLLTTAFRGHLVW